MLSHLAGQVSQDFVPVGQLDPEGGIGQQFFDDALDFDFVLLGRR